MSTVVLAGGSGFLGRSLAAYLSDLGYRVAIISRSAPLAGIPQAETVRWDAKTIGPWCATLEGAAAVINLVGKSVNCRYTAENQREIVESRVGSVRLLGEAIGRCRRAPRVFVQAGSLAIYGDAGEETCTERTPPGTGFGAGVCVEWEAALDSLKLPSTRMVTLRIGFALGRGGGALQPLSALTKWFLGGPAGDGRQYISWIHIRDLNKMFKWSIERPDLSGVFNATGPSPVTNREFMRELRSALGRPWSPPVPALAVKLGAVAMRTDASLALTGRRCLPSRFLEQGFQFQFSQLAIALSEILGQAGTGENALA